MINTGSAKPVAYQGQEQRQQHVVRQNFANNVLFMNLSAMESIEQKYKGENKPKFFGAYDVVDYSHRPIQVLKQQLRLGLFQIQISVDARRSDGGFILPGSYNIQQVMQKLSEFKQYFHSKDQDCQKMVDDVINILTGKDCQRAYQTMKFKSQSNGDFKSNTKNMLKANNKMHEKQIKMEQQYKPGMKEEDIGFQFNTSIGKVEEKKKQSISHQMQEELPQKKQQSKQQKKGIVDKVTDFFFG